MVGRGIELQARHNRNQSVRQSDENAILVVSEEKVQCYRQSLYFFNFILSGLGLALLSMGVVMRVRPDDILLPSWALYWFITLGLFQIIFGVLAARGAVLAKKNIKQGQFNWWLFTFLVAITLVLLFELFIVAISIVKSLDVKQSDVSEGSDFILDYAENSLKSEMEEREDFWWNWQKSWECCGWNNNTIPDKLATGKYCTTDSFTSAKPCKDDVEDYLVSNVVVLIIFAGVFMMSQMFVCFSACQLACCIQAMEPVYSSHS